ncbi:MAG: type II toxin-antitoxin system RelE/ParE family toxin [Chlorobium sp.]
MNIRYHTRKLEKSVENIFTIRKHYGDRAKKVALRLQQLAAAANLDAVRILPSANCHELKADRVGEIAVDISPNHRIIFIPDHNPLPKKDDGGLDWKSVTGIVIMTIGEDYH